MRWRRWRAIIVVLICFLVIMLFLSLRKQIPPIYKGDDVVWREAFLDTPIELPQLTQDSLVSLVTIAPGEDIYASFGHVGIRIYDPSVGLDRLYNYGTFYFNDPFFIFKFINGQLDYTLAVESYPRALRFYREQQFQYASQQVLDLTLEERQQLYTYLEVNMLPENRVYRYDFLYDNCSTRVRDVLERVIGADLVFDTSLDPYSSFRRLLDRYLRPKPWLDLGIDIILGTPADREVSYWSVMFLPDYLYLAVDRAELDRNGDRVPLVEREIKLIEGARTPPKRRPLWGQPVFYAWLFFGILFLFALLSVLRKQWYVALFDPIYFTILGLFGLLLAYLWFISNHHVMNWNMNLLWMNPLYIPAAILVAARKRSFVLGLFWLFSAIMCITLIIGWPWWPQWFHPVFLPLMLVIIIRSLRMYQVNMQHAKRIKAKTGKSGN
jgi:hypothetical protein